MNDYGYGPRNKVLLVTRTSVEGRLGARTSRPPLWAHLCIPHRSHIGPDEESARTSTPYPA